MLEILFPLIIGFIAWLTGEKEDDCYLPAAIILGIIGFIIFSINESKSDV